VNDSGLRVAPFMRFLGFGSRRGRMVERSDFGRLLPVCCPKECLEPEAWLRGAPQSSDSATAMSSSPALRAGTAGIHRRRPDGHGSRLMRVRSLRCWTAAA
jgi:hypothetical protein